MQGQELAVMILVVPFQLRVVCDQGRSEFLVLRQEAVKQVSPS